MKERTYSISSRCPKCHQHHVVKVTCDSSEILMWQDVYQFSDCPKCSGKTATPTNG